MNNPTINPMNKAQNNLEVLCCNLMSVCCDYMDKGQVELADEFNNLVDTLIDQGGYNHEVFINTGKLVIN